MAGRDAPRPQKTETAKAPAPTRDIRKRIAIDAPPERVWAAWTDPAHLVRWYADRAEGTARVGERLSWSWDSFGFTAELEVERAVAPRELVLVADVPGRGKQRQRVAIDSEDGSTVLTLVHEGFGAGAKWDEEVAGVSSGWAIALSILRRYVERFFGRDRRGFFVRRPATFTFDALAPYYRDAEHLERWLTDRGAIGDVGERVKLTLQTGMELTGLVLARTRHEVLLSWDQISGVLTLKAYPAGARRREVAVHGFGWGLGDALAEEIGEGMEEAVARLVRTVRGA